MYFCSIGVANRLFVENQLLIMEYKYENKRVFPSRKCTIPNDNFSNQPKFLSMHNRSDYVCKFKPHLGILLHIFYFTANSDDRVEQNNYSI